MGFNGWSEYQLGEIASFKNGLNFTKSDVGEEIKIVGVADFQDRTELANTAKLTTIRVRLSACSPTAANGSWRW